ncbi:MAG: hypothetical protein F6J98_38570 [Moorea sp. SIO4G2]|nr:hypothetical protein [Moorena sp. SIO4G2]
MAKGHAIAFNLLTLAKGHAIAFNLGQKATQSRSTFNQTTFNQTTFNLQPANLPTFIFHNSYFIFQTL